MYPCDTLSPLMCHNTVIIFSFTIFLATHGSYIIRLKTLFFKSVTSFRWNIIALQNSIYIYIYLYIYFHLTYNTFTLFSFTMYFQYSVESIFANSYSSHPLNIMVPSLSDSVCRYVPGMSMVVTYLPLCASMYEVIMIASSYMVGEAASYFYVFLLFYPILKCPSFIYGVSFLYYKH